mgnify:CR=1 FL=1
MQVEVLVAGRRGALLSTVHFSWGSQDCLPSVWLPEFRSCGFGGSLAQKKKKSTQPFTSDGDSMGPHKQFRVSQIPHGNDSWKKKSVLFRVLRTSEVRQCGFWGGLAQKDQHNTLRMIEMLVQLISGPIWGPRNTPWGQLLEKNSMLFCMLWTSEVKRRGFWGGLAQKDQHNPATVMEMLAQLVPT